MVAEAKVRVGPRLLERLVCPVTRTQLSVDAQGNLVSEAGLVFPIVDGIPVLIPGDARKVGDSTPQPKREVRLEETKEYAESYSGARRTVAGTIEYEDYWDGRLTSLLTGEPDLPALDIMCGDGIFLPALSRRHPDVTGIDLSVELLKLVPREWRSSVVAGDALKMPFADNTFGAAVVRGGLHHIPDHLAAAFSEIGRVLRPGGSLVFLEPCDDNPLIKGFRKLVYKMSPHFDEDEERGLTTDELRTALESNGFSMQVVVKSGFVGYATLLNTQILKPLRMLGGMPGARTFAKALIGFDELWEKLPVASSLTFNMFVAARKGN